MPAGKVFTSIAVGFTHACASTSDGLAYCWGSNDAGRLGIGSTSPSTTPVAVDMTGSLASTTVTSITAGYSYGCVVASGAAYCWGQQEGGKLGNNDGTAFSRTTPVPCLHGRPPLGPDRHRHRRRWHVVAVRAGDAWDGVNLRDRERRRLLLGIRWFGSPRNGQHVE